jgi:hypothetical protein
VAHRERRIVDRLGGDRSEWRTSVGIVSERNGIGEEIWIEEWIQQGGGG